MLQIRINDMTYEYDVNAIVRSFFPQEEIEVVVGSRPKITEEHVSLLVVEAGEEECAISVWSPTTLLREYRRVYGPYGAENAVQTAIADQGAENEVQTSTADQGAEDTDGVEPSPEEVAAYRKAVCKRFLYECLRDYTGKELPWGNLTGIRPTKLAMTMLEKNMSDEAIIGYLQQNHFVSRQKAELSIDIAKRERTILDGIHYENGYSLYIGIPFCPTTCLYCSFTSYPLCVWEKRMDQYLDALCKEMDCVAELVKDKQLDTIYVGGGTPTTLSAERLDRMLTKIRSTFDLTRVKEFTVEAGRADSITGEKLEVMKQHRVGRISVNPQTMHDRTLKLIGRQHTVAQVEDAFRLAREIGFDNINMDIILGLPEETDADVAETVRRIEALNPDSLTVHSLAIKRASKLNRFIRENGYIMSNNTEETMRIAAEGASRMGMKPYYLYRQKNMTGNFENVGYAREDKNGIYNILIMEEKQTIVALGAGSITKRVFPDGRIERCENVKDVALYMDKIDEMIARKQKLFEES